jgi:TetR/AcrR family transcriptional regulator, fatty acid metabolism regulator protein
MAVHSKTRVRSPRAAPENGSSAEKHHRILQAAIAVFAENGYFNSRVADIAERAGVADGTIYLYFKNKEQILMAAIDFAFSSFMRAAQTELASIDDPRQKLRRLAALHLESLGANRGLAMVFQTELRQSAKFLSEFSHRHLIEYFDLVRAIVRQGQQSGCFRKEVSDKIAANCFFGALDAMVTSWLLSERDYKLGAASDALVDVILNGMEAHA